MDVRRRMINTPPPTADNVFVIDDIVFEKHFNNEYISYMNTNEIYLKLKDFCINNGETDGFVYVIIHPVITFYLYDLKIPITKIEYDTMSAEVCIHSDYFPLSTATIIYSEILYGGGPLIGGLILDHIPTTPLEAIIFVEFAKQMGLDAFEIDNYNVYWLEEGKVLFIGNGMVEYYVYGAYNDEKTGIIEFYDIYPDGGGGAN